MSQRLPARPGDPLGAIDTPALIVDLAAFERNLDAMATATTARGIRLRPHAKSHKCPAIAHAQIARGAVGICCQKTDEAAAFVDAGVSDVLLTNEVVDPAKLARLAALATRARIGLLADHADAVPRIAQAAQSHGVTLDVYVEVDVGAARCGVTSPEAAATLAVAIASSAGLRFAGLHAYHGGAQHLRSPSQRTAAILAAAERTERAKAAIERGGLSCAIVTGAGTGTWPVERDSGLWNELQPGSYVFMDADYGRNDRAPGTPAFEQSLFVLAQLMSVPGAGRAVCDAGLKAFAFDSGLPLVDFRLGVRYAKASDEHGTLEVDAEAPRPFLGERLRLIPGHCDPTVNLYDWIVAVRGGVVEDVWPVSARGTLG